MEQKTVAVVGAGASGLTAIKTCLEHDLNVVCFERSGDIGGWWRFQEPGAIDEEWRPSVPANRVTRSSKEMFSFSDFPPRQDHPNFMPHARVMEYLRRYSTRFLLTPHVKFGCRVAKIHRSDSYGDTGRWVVHYVSKNAMQEEIFDAVLLCNNHLTIPHLPSIKGSKNFLGQSFHIQQYKTPFGFRDKRVVVVGGRSDAFDLATELSYFAAQVVLSVNQGSWLVSRLDKSGRPWDLENVSRGSEFMFQFPNLFKDGCSFGGPKGSTSIFPGLSSEKLVDGTNPNVPFAVSDGLMSRLHCGKVLLKPSLAKLDAKVAYFADGSSEFGVDAVIFDSGYGFETPLEDNAIHAKMGFYKHMFPTGLADLNLAFIGLVEASNGGDTLSLAEMQCRLACQIITGAISHPTPADLTKDVYARKQCVPNLGFPICVDYIGYMDDLSSLFAARPRIVLRPAFLNYNLMFGPCAPYQYRLHGLQSWPGAMQAIVEARSRTQSPIDEWRGVVAKTSGKRAPPPPPPVVHVTEPDGEWGDTVFAKKATPGGAYRKEMSEIICSVAYVLFWVFKILVIDLARHPRENREKIKCLIAILAVVFGMYLARWLVAV